MTKENTFKFRDIWSLLKETAVEWTSNQPFRLSAVVSYYALLSLPGLLVIIVNAVGAIWGQEIVRGELHGEFINILGVDGANSIESMIGGVLRENKSIISTIIGFATLLFGATGVFYHLQLSLNEIFKIKQKEDAGIWRLAIDRARGFGFVLVVGFLLLISFVLTAALSILSSYIQRSFPDFLIYLANALDIFISLGVISVLFALIFRYLPDVRIKWKTVWIGAILTSILFSIGKFLLGYYFGKADPSSTYGAAGSIVLVLLWISYSCLILFFGAAFTYVYANRYGPGVIPTRNAVRYTEKVELEEDQDSDSNRKKEEDKKTDSTKAP